MIDPLHSLAFSIQANRGVYAILLGSGVSRVSKIPTGWEITLDLVLKLANLHGEQCSPDPESWYQKKFGVAPDYSELLNQLAKSPTERQQLLRSYWEPTEQEREKGEKQPTAAHRAIATMVAGGFIRLILTTNFDRLIENALSDVGVVPTILSSPEQVNGAIPLIHTQCCIFKIHGDYLDPCIRNTRAELNQYPAEFDDLLDRIFDEFGLIVCGWSGEWDDALREAIFRAESRRYTTYWTIRDVPNDEVQRLIDHRGAQIVRITDADSFFQKIQQYTESIEESSRPHPLSSEAAVTNLKRYVSGDQYRIQLMDLVDHTIEEVVQAVAGETFSTSTDGAAPPNAASITARVRAYEAACSTLLAMAPIGGFWAERQHHPIWRRALTRLCTQTSKGGYSVWLDLQKYPATLLFYALGLGAVEAGRLEFLGFLFTVIVPKDPYEDMSAVEMLHPTYISTSGAGEALEGMEKHHVPFSDWLHQALREAVRGIIPDDERYTLIFDKFEMLIALACAHRGKQTMGGCWPHVGAFCYRQSSRNRIAQEIQGSLNDEENNSPFVKNKIFGETVDECRIGLAELDKFISSTWWGY